MTESERVEFFVQGKPQPQPRPRFAKCRNGGMRAYSGIPITKWKRFVHVAALQTMVKFEKVPVCVELQFILKRPDCHITDRRLKGPPKVMPKAPLTHSQKPDVDNLAKGVLDGLSGALFNDDAQVVQLHCSKHWGEPGDREGCLVAAWAWYPALQAESHEKDQSKERSDS
jgi:Holliday junction resolvase RusA-like endonuclease